MEGEQDASFEILIWAQNWGRRHLLSPMQGKLYFSLLEFFKIQISIAATKFRPFIRIVNIPNTRAKTLEPKV